MHKTNPNIGSAFWRFFPTIKKNEKADLEIWTDREGSTILNYLLTETSSTFTDYEKVLDAIEVLAVVKTASGSNTSDKRRCRAGEAILLSSILKIRGLNDHDQLNNYLIL